MAATPETGFLVIADLTGYTAYLSGSEIEHAPAIAGDLLETIVGRLEPPFRLAKFEGDAAFLFVEDGRADGSLLLDAIEAAYLAFRRRLRSIDQATTCDCNSCRLAPRLDLKVFVHHGAFVWSRIAGRDELAGSDVIIVHRLLKGAGAAEARANGFALFTAAAVDALGLDPDALRLRARRGVDRAPRPGRHLHPGPRGPLAGRERRAPARHRRGGSSPSTSRRPSPPSRRCLGAPDLARPANALGGTDPHRGDVGRRAPRRRDHGPVRDRTAGDARGDRRLAALRPRRLAAGRARASARSRPPRISIRPRAGPVSGFAGRTRAERPPTPARSSGCGATRRPPTRASPRSSPARCRSSSRRRLGHEHVRRTSRRSSGRRRTSGRTPRTSSAIRSG